MGMKELKITSQFKKDLKLKITSQFKKDLKKYQNQPISSSCYDLELTRSCSGNILKVIG